MTADASAQPAATTNLLHHVRLTVSDIERSRAFYENVLGFEAAMASEGDPSDPDVRADPQQLFGGVIFAVGDQLFGLRPVGPSGDTFDSARIGLDHLSFSVGSRDDLVAAAERLTEQSVEHGDVMDLPGGMAILSFQDPDNINIELVATS